MENASKALIIAGAILLSILLISLGLIVFTNAQESINGNDLSAEQKQTFNNKVVNFAGDNVTGSKTNELIQKVIGINEAEKEAGTNRFISISGYITTTATDYAVTKSRVATGKQYKIEMATYTKGLVSAISITPVGAAAPAGS